MAGVTVTCVHFVTNRYGSVVLDDGSALRTALAGNIWIWGGMSQVAYPM